MCNYLDSSTRLEYILCAAHHYQDNKQYAHQPKNIDNGYVVCGRRHHNITRIHVALTGKRDAELGFPIEDGFITNLDRFVDRKEALQIALAANQIMNTSNLRSYMLFSEDLY